MNEVLFAGEGEGRMSEALRAESSVSVSLDEFGQVTFAADRNGAVIHRTPEELGIPRVVEAAPRVRREELSMAGVQYVRKIPSVEAPAARVKREELSPAGAEHLHKMLRKAPLKRLYGEPVRMPAMATMGAEMLGQGVASQQVGELADQQVSEVETRRKMSTASELKALVMAEPMDMPVSEVMAKHGASKQQIYNWRYEARKKAGHIPEKKFAPKKPKATKLKSSGLQRVEVDPQRPGTASSLPGALAKQDAAAERIKIEIELSVAEMAAIVGRLGGTQRQAFFTAGIRAALLAN